MIIKLFENFVEENFKKDLIDGMKECLVELNDNLTFEYDIDINMKDKVIIVVINLDESNITDDVYSALKFDASSISDTILLLESYMIERFGNDLKIEYTIDNSDFYMIYKKYPTIEEVNRFIRNGSFEELENIKYATDLMLKYRWRGEL